MKQPKGDEPLTANMMVKATSTVEAITGDAAWMDRTAFDDARKESPEVKKKKMNNRHEEEREW